VSPTAFMTIAFEILVSPCRSIRKSLFHHSWLQTTDWRSCHWSEKRADFRHHDRSVRLTHSRRRTDRNICCQTPHEEHGWLRA
jgi:hypothetical protein